MTRHLILLLLTISTSALGQIKIGVQVDSNEYLIGDQVHLVLEVKAEPMSRIMFPHFSDTLASFEILDQGIVEVFAEDGRQIQRQRMILTAFDSGAYVIPAFKFLSLTAGGVDTLHSRPIPILMSNLPVDLQADIKAIKQPMDAPFHIIDIWEWLLAAYLLLLAISLLVYWLERRGGKEQQVKPIQINTPYEIAMNRLRELEEQKLWQSGKIKLYYIQLTEIVREYIESRFGIMAMESTTAELINDFQQVLIETETKKELKGLLELSDFVKFAKAQPVSSEHEASLKQAYSFLRSTRPSLNQDKMKSNHV